VVEQAIEQGGDGGRVAEELPPVMDRSIRSQQRGGPFVASHDHFEEVLGGGVRQLPHAKAVDDQERDRGQIREIGLAGPVQCRVGDLLEELYLALGSTA
jgi:hypothetical protein